MLKNLRRSAESRVSSGFQHISAFLQGSRTGRSAEKAFRSAENTRRSAESRASSGFQHISAFLQGS
ncbi:hypothetical protein FCG41_04925 [Azotobacter chroococcum]|nr:hypothetical protein FCG41_04925 [Azotobacter chroococcum]